MLFIIVVVVSGANFRKTKKAQIGTIHKFEKKNAIFIMIVDRNWKNANFPVFYQFSKQTTISLHNNNNNWDKRKIWNKIVCKKHLH